MMRAADLGAKTQFQPFVLCTVGTLETAGLLVVAAVMQRRKDVSVSGQRALELNSRVLNNVQSHTCKPEPSPAILVRGQKTA